MPYEIKDKEAKAKWVADKHILELTCPIDRVDLTPYWLNFKISKMKSFKFGFYFIFSTIIKVSFLNQI